MDTTIKVTSISVIMGVIAGFASAGLSIGWLGFTNGVFAFLLGLILIYATVQISKNIAGDEISGTSQLIWDCVSPFFFTWIIVWILCTNYL